MTLALSEPARIQAGTEDVPLVVDLDGTLLRTDTLIESLLSYVGRDPLGLLRLLPSLRFGRAVLKARLAAVSGLDVANLPLNMQVVDFITLERARGRQIYLASAADRHIVEQVSEALGLFDGVFASDGQQNLAGQGKADVLKEAFGEHGFDYIGNDEPDLAVWQSARTPLLADAAAGLARRARQRWPNVQVVSEHKFRIGTYLKAIRVHQWLKNVLLLVPVLAAHELDPATLAVCLIGMLSFGLCASSVYLTNDLLDLPHDRLHRTKRHRPFAAGAIPLLHGLFMSPAFLVGAVLCGIVVGPSFLIVLGLYWLATLAYSLVLKRQMLLDVITLAGLYGLRLFAGAVAVDIKLSAWLGTFALFIFFCLALVKRCAELTELNTMGRGKAAGRGYRAGDLSVLVAMAAASGFTATLVVALYADSAAVRAIYHSPNRLYLICVVLLYWIGRILMLTQRNEMHEDPVLFAATDRISQGCALACLAIVLASL